MNFQAICRICIREYSEMISIFESYKFSAHNCQIFKVITDCASVQIRRFDGFSEQICRRCLHLLSQAYSFKKLCEDSDYKFRNDFDANDRIKLKDEFLAEDTKIICNDQIVNNSTENRNGDFGLSQIVRGLNTVQNNLSEQSNEIKTENQSAENRDVRQAANLFNGVIIESVERKPLIGLKDSPRYIKNVAGGDSDTSYNFELSSESLAEEKYLAPLMKIPAEPDETSNVDLDDLYSIDDIGIKNEFSEEETIINYGDIEIDIQENNVEIDKVTDFTEDAEQCNVEIGTQNISAHDQDSLKCQNDARKVQSAENTSCTSNSSYNCQLCHKSFNANRYLAVHTKVHKTQGLHKCNVCSKKFLLNTDLKQHIRMHAGQKPFEYGNDLTHKVTHIRLHTGEKPDAVVQELNDITLHTEEKLEKGEQSLPSAVLKSVEYKKPEDLKKAKFNNVKHASGENSFECYVCGKIFIDKSDLVVHIRLHMGEKPDAVVQQKQLNDDITLHIGKKPSAAEKEEQSLPIAALKSIEYKKPEDLKKTQYNNVKHASGEKFECYICEKIFTDKSDLVAHIRLHMGEKPCALEKKELNVLSLQNANLKSIECKSPRDLNLENITRDPSTSYGCEICSKSFRSKRSIAMHMKVHKRKRLHKCNVCDKKFFQGTDLKQHMRTHGTLQCYVCEKKFAEKSELVIHLRLHTGEKLLNPAWLPRVVIKNINCNKLSASNSSCKCEICSKSINEEKCEKKFSPLKRPARKQPQILRFKCEICEEKFNYNFKLVRHLRLHTGETPFKCEICPKSFAYKCSLKEHVKVHTKEKPFACGVCGKPFASKGNIKKHMQTHSGEKRYKCDVCGDKFGRSNYLDMHMKLHTGDRPFKCNLCDKTYITKGQLKLHMVTHKGDKEFKCNLCHKDFLHKSTLVVHLRTHSGERPYKCDVCDKKFFDKYHLDSHKKLHTGEKPHRCEICDRKFSVRYNLERHIRTHTGVKKYQCGYCDMKFSQKSTLTKHIRLHTGEKPYKCEFCEMEFVHNDSFQRHRIREHGW